MYSRLGLQRQVRVAAAAGEEEQQEQHRQHKCMRAAIYIMRVLYQSYLDIILR
jgi:hypothetical protein